MRDVIEDGHHGVVFFLEEKGGGCVRGAVKCRVDGGRSKRG